MTGVALLLTVFVLLGFRHTGRLGSTHVWVLVASALLIGGMSLQLGR
jgi:hypothetical protein